MKYKQLVPRFLNYVKQNTRSDENSQTVPSTQRQVDFLLKLKAELEEIGLSEVLYDPKTAYLTATLPANTAKNIPVVGFLSHVDTADFNSEGINPQEVKNYDGQSTIQLDSLGKYQLDTKVFPTLQKYAGHTLITTDGSNLL